MPKTREQKRQEAEARVAERRELMEQCPWARSNTPLNRMRDRLAEEVSRSQTAAKAQES